MPHRVFSYGTLRLPSVQQALYGRAVPTVDDALPGFVLDWVTITDQEVLAASGSDRHPILRRAEGGAAVPGAYLELDDRELAATDDYEVDDERLARAVRDGGLDDLSAFAAAIAGLVTP